MQSVNTSCCCCLRQVINENEKARFAKPQPKRETLRQVPPTLYWRRVTFHLAEVLNHFGESGGSMVTSSVTGTEGRPSLKTTLPCRLRSKTEEWQQQLAHGLLGRTWGLHVGTFLWTAGEEDTRRLHPEASIVDSGLVSACDTSIPHSHSASSGSSASIRLPANDAYQSSGRCSKRFGLSYPRETIYAPGFSLTQPQLQPLCLFLERSLSLWLSVSPSFPASLHLPFK